MNFYLTDCDSLWMHLKRQEKQIKCKRRWILGLSSSKDGDQLGLPGSLEDRFMSEYLLREDDIFYDTVKKYVKECFQECYVKRRRYIGEDSMQALGMVNMKRALIFHLDNFTSKGLYLLATILTGGSIKFAKTRPKMKKVIHELLRKHDTYAWPLKRSKELAQLLNNTCHFQENHVPFPACQSYRAAAIEVLDGLEKLPFQTLIAMHRKLRGVKKGSTSQLQSHRSGWNRGRLVDHVRKTCKRMLSELGKGDQLQEPLAKAMAVADLSANLLSGLKNHAVTEFHRPSPDILSLQNEIARAIWIVKNKLRLADLRTLQHLLDPKANVSNGCLRMAVEKMLIEYLFECSDMDAIPKPLLDTLAIIDRNSPGASHRWFLKAEVEEEVECILSVTGQAKQIIIELLPDCKFDQDFTDAYMEEFAESENDDENDDLCQSSSLYSSDTVELSESTGESNVVDFRSPVSLAKEDGSVLLRNKLGVNSDLIGRHEYEKISGTNCANINMFSASQASRALVTPKDIDLDHCEVEIIRSEIPTSAENGHASPTSTNGHLNGNIDVTEVNLPDLIPSESSNVEATTCNNDYLAIQNICDETSLIAHRLVGQIMAELAKSEGCDLDWNEELYLRGDHSASEYSEVAKEYYSSSLEDTGVSIVIRAIENVIPSFPESGTEKVKELMRLL